MKSPQYGWVEKDGARAWGCLNHGTAWMVPSGGYAFCERCVEEDDCDRCGGRRKLGTGRFASRCPECSPEEAAQLRLAIREHRNATERDFSADITIADERLWEVLGER